MKKSLDMIGDLKEKGGDDWENFSKNFGKYLKVGIVEDNDNRKDIAPLVRFQSTADPKATITLGDYVGRMKEGQDCIYYVSGEGRAQCELSPALDKIKEQGYEVLFCTDPLDELCMVEIKDFEGKEVIDLSKDTVKGVDTEAKVSFCRLRSRVPNSGCRDCSGYQAIERVHVA